MVKTQNLFKRLEQKLHKFEDLHSQIFEKVSNSLIIKKMKVDCPTDARHRTAKID